MRTRVILSFLVALVLASSARAQAADDLLAQVRQRQQVHEQKMTYRVAGTWMRAATLSVFAPAAAGQLLRQVRQEVLEDSDMSEAARQRLLRSLGR